MRIKPGDHVVIPFSESVSEFEAARLKEGLEGVMPGVKWGVIDGTAMTHALVFEGADPASPDVLAMAKRYEAKLTTALDLLSEIIGTFSDKGSIGGIDNVLRSTWRDVDQVSRWQQWIADARRMS